MSRRSTPAIRALGARNSARAHERRLSWLRECAATRSSADCWEWPWAHSPKGYGVYKHNRRSFQAHRLSYQLFRGKIPTGLVIDHLCRNPRCVNPAHLEPVTRVENTMRSPIHWAPENAAKTRCAYGHEFTPENTRIARDGSRVCRACARLHSLAYYHRTKGRK